jgi:acyl carrier protein
MTEPDELSLRVRRIIAERLDVPESHVQPYATFVGDLGADSLSLVELVMAFEDAFEIDIPDEAAERIRTVQDATDFLGRHWSSPPPPIVAPS